MLNTLLSSVYDYIVDTLLSYMDERIDHFFPEDKNRPSLKELMNRAALGLQYGHPLIADGARPLPPSHVLIGMMGCLPTGNITDEKLDGLMNSKIAKEHGVIVVSFGTLLKAHMVRDIYLFIIVMRKGYFYILPKIWH